MPVVNISKKYLLRLMSLELTDKQLTDQLTKMGLGVDEMAEDKLSLEISPNRPDLFGAVGLARSLKNFLHRSKRLVYQVKAETPEFELDVGKEVNSIRPYIASFAVHGLKLDDDMLTDAINFTEKLCQTYGRERKKIAIGLHDLADIEPPLHYNAYKEESFVPLNETKEKTFSEIIRTHSKGIQYGSILSGTSRYPALKDNIGVLSLIPITNAERGRVTTKTTDLIVVVDGTQHEPINKTADMVACMFLDLGVDIKPVQVNYPGKSELTPLMTSKNISMPVSLAEGEIGVEIGYNNVISLANKMGYEAALLDRNVRFRIPEYRMDIINEQDVIEDIAIAYGYDYIKPMPLFSIQRGALQAKSTFFSDVSEAMVGMKFSEMMNTYLTNEKANFHDMRIADPAKYLSSFGFDYVKLKNPRAQSISMMRTWLLPNLLKDISLSRHERMPQRLFELDMIFYLSKSVPCEDYHLGAILTDPKSNLNEVKGVINSLAYYLKLDIKTSRYDHPSFIPGRCASINMGKEMFGFFGELHPQVLNSFGIEEPTSAFEMNLMPILELMEQ